MKVILFILIYLSLLNANINSGDTLPPLALVDQFNNKVKVQSNATLIISFQKSVSSEIQTYLASKPKKILKKNNILYISDISTAPTFMIKLFGIPKMKKFGYKVALIYDEKIADNLKREVDKVTVIKLHNHKVSSIQYVSAKELNNVLAH